MPAIARKTTATKPTATPVFTVVTPPQPVTATPPPKKKGLNITGIAPAPAKTGGKTYPLVLPDLEGEELEEFKALVSTLLDEKAEYAGLEGTILSHTGDVLRQIRPKIHQLASGSAENSHAVLVEGTNGDVALINMIKKYKLVFDSAAVIAAIGEANFDEFIDEKTVLKIDFQKVPEAVQQEFLSAIIAEAQRLNCTGAVEAKQAFAPKPHFHALRRTRLTVEENIALDAVMPLEIHVKRKGGAGED
jgi:hypothetical protein